MDFRRFFLLFGSFMLLGASDLGAESYINLCDVDGDGIESYDCGGMDCDDFDANLGFIDADGDGTSPEYCFDSRGLDCDDLNPLRSGAFIEVCDPGGLDEDCDFGTQIDRDGDGAAALECGGDDCDDTDPNRFPGNPEICDAGVDQDCDDTTFGLLDADGDGFISSQCISILPDGKRVGGTDCDDSVPTVHPISSEACDGVDQNCDGDVDEGVTATLYADWDLDGHGDVGSPAYNLCAGVSGFAPVANDCDDTNPAIRPGDQVCVMDDAQALLTCASDGRWVASTCPSGTLCFAQNNGTGLCLETKYADKKPYKD